VKFAPSVTIPTYLLPLSPLWLDCGGVTYGWVQDNIITTCTVDDGECPATSSSLANAIGLSYSGSSYEGAFMEDIPKQNNYTVHRQSYVQLLLLKTAV
jgi:hypothetical protein